MTDSSGGTSRLAGPLVGAGFGIALGAVAIALYAFARRVPTGLISDRLGPVSSALGWSLAVGVVVALVLGYQGVRSLAGIPVAGQMAWLAAGLALVTTAGYLHSMPGERAALISGPGSQPVIALAQVSWLLLTVAAVVLLAAAVAGVAPRRPVWPMVTWTAAGLVVAVAVGSAVVAVAAPGGQPATTATAIAVPEMPTAVGADVAYTVSVSGWVTPAGPGFVAAGGQALVGYDGASGTARWRFPFSGLPHGCTPATVRSTGTGPDAVVLLECRREVRNYDAGKTPFLVGLDAMTGQRLWTADSGWRLAGRTPASPDAVPVLRGDDIGSLDPRAGTMRWTHHLSDDEACSADSATGVRHSIVVLANCHEQGALRVFDSLTGADRTVDLTVIADAPKGDGAAYDVVGAYDDSVALVGSVHPSSSSPVLLVVNTATSAMEVVHSQGFMAYLADRDSLSKGQYPGPVLQLDQQIDPQEPTTLYLLGSGRTIVTTGVNTLDKSIPTGQRWALVGDHLVSADGYISGATMLIVGPEGVAQQRPSPCGSDVGGVMTVPGALLVLCERGTGERRIDGYDIIGLR